MSSTSSSPPPSTTTTKKIRLRSSDDQIFDVEEKVAMESKTISNMIEDNCADNVIPLPNVTGKILAKVIEYCKKHAEEKSVINKEDFYFSPSVPDSLKEWDTEFVKVDQNTLFDIILAANYLDIKNLLDLFCESVANMMKGKSPEDIRQIFNIKNDYTPEEEAEIRRENQWAFE